MYIRECGFVLYLGMAKEILNLSWLCITWIMAKEAANLKPSERHRFCHSSPFQPVCLQTGKSGGFG